MCTIYDYIFHFIKKWKKIQLRLRVSTVKFVKKAFLGMNTRRNILLLSMERRKNLFAIYAVLSTSFVLKIKLTSHIENNHQGGHHTCKSCGKVFARSGSLEKHIKAIHEAQRN